MPCVSAMLRERQLQAMRLHEAHLPSIKTFTEIPSPVQYCSLIQAQLKEANKGMAERNQEIAELQHETMMKNQATIG